MLDALIPAILVMLIAFIAFAGAIAIAGGGFFRMVTGSLIVALLLSLSFSSCAAILLEASSGLPHNAFPVAIVRSLLAAFTQPTLSGIALLAILVVGTSAAARVCGLVEDVQILLDTHKVVVGNNKSGVGKQ